MSAQYVAISTFRRKGSSIFCFIITGFFILSLVISYSFSACLSLASLILLAISLFNSVTSNLFFSFISSLVLVSVSDCIEDTFVLCLEKAPPPPFFERSIEESFDILYMYRAKFKNTRVIMLTRK